MADADTKQCTQCKQYLPHTSFYVSPSRKDGLYPWCRPCTNRKTREYTDRKPDWKEIKRAYDKARVAKLRDKLRAQYQVRYAAKRDEIIRQTKEYAKAHPEQVKSTKQAYKHRRRTVERAGMSGGDFQAWKGSQPKVCHWCGIKCARGFVVDHIQPLAKGGKHEAHNLAISCRSCNARKSARDPIEWAQMIGKLL